MLDNNEYTLTDTVLAQMAGTQNPRLKEVMVCAVRHLHAFARDIKLTPEEWLAGIKFITAVGQASTALRQETILLSDVLGLSAMVNALHDDGRADASSDSSLLGPFFREGAPLLPAGAQIVQHRTGPEIVIYGRISDDTSEPIKVPRSPPPRSQKNLLRKAASRTVRLNLSHHVETLARPSLCRRHQECKPDAAQNPSRRQQASILFHRS